MRKNIILFLSIISFVTLPCVSHAQQVQSKAYDLMLKALLKHDVPEIGVSQIPKNDTAIVFLDARTLQEYKVSHIRNAVWVGDEDFNISRVPADLQKRKMIVYCSVGYRSEKVAEKLEKAGYNQVKNLYGGIFEWVNDKRPVYDSIGVTKRVHAYNHLWGIWLKKGVKVY